jgi:hypothetical protein
VGGLLVYILDPILFFYSAIFYGEEITQSAQHTRFRTKWSGGNSNLVRTTYAGRSGQHTPEVRTTCAGGSDNMRRRSRQHAPEVRTTYAGGPDHMRRRSGSRASDLFPESEYAISTLESGVLRKLLAAYSKPSSHCVHYLQDLVLDHRVRLHILCGTAALRLLEEVIEIWKAFWRQNPSRSSKALWMPKKFGSIRTWRSLVPVRASMGIWICSR